MKSRRKHGFQFMTILYFMIVFSMCVSRFNVIMTIMGGQLTRVEEINLLPFHSVRENLQYGRNPISWDMLYNMVMFVPFGIIYCYYQKHFRVYKAVGMSCLTTFFIESAQFILKTGVVDIDDFIVNTLGSLMGIMAYAILQQISFKNQKFEIHELIDICSSVSSREIYSASINIPSIRLVYSLNGVDCWRNQEIKLIKNCCCCGVQLLS